jgi:hypothetical protein
VIGRLLTAPEVCLQASVERGLGHDGEDDSVAKLRYGTREEIRQRIWGDG